MPTDRETQTQKLARLEAENARLAQELADARTVAQAQAQAQATAVEAQPAKRRGRGRTVGAIVVLVIATLLAPVALIASSTVRQFTNTEEFVRTLAPLIDDPSVQDFLVDQVVLAIDENVDIEGLVAAAFDGLDDLNLAPRATDALRRLQPALVGGINSIIEQKTRELIESEQFSDVFANVLRLSHSQLIATLEGSDDAAVTIDPNGTVDLQLGPIVAAVKQRLEDQGVGFASLIPEVDRSVTIAENTQLARVSTAYQILLVVGFWLIYVDLLLFVLAVLLAMRRSVMIVVAGLCLAGISAIVGIGVAVGRIAVVSALTPFVPSGAADAVYDALVTDIVALSTVLVVLGLTIALIGYLATPWRSARALRTFADSSADSLAGYASSRGISTGGFGGFLAKWRIPLRIGIGVIAAAIILFVRPVTPGLIIWTAVLALLLVIVLRLLERPTLVQPPVAAPMTS
jgi:hypothetical protein